MLHLAPYDWIHRAFRVTVKCGGECTEKSKKSKKLLWPKSLQEVVAPSAGVDKKVPFIIIKFVITGEGQTSFIFDMKSVVCILRHLVFSKIPKIF